MGRLDQRSEAARAYRHLYWTAEWQRARERQLAEHPLCERCEKAGFTVAATVVNHRKPHRGDRILFFDPENHESACAPCHDIVIGAEERTGKPSSRVGYKAEVGADGWPTDPRHPANGRQRG